MTKNKNILMALYYYDPYVSGLSVYAKSLAERLVSDGYAVTILTSQYDLKLPKSEVINGVKIIRKKVLFSFGKGIIMPGFWLEMVRLARKADLVNPFLPMAEVGLPALFISRKKFVPSYVCDLNLGEGLVAKTIQWLSFVSMKLALLRAHKVFVLSLDYINHSVMRRFAGKSIGVYPMIDEHEFKAVSSEKLFKKIGVQKQEKRIGFVGRIVYEKGIEFLLESIPYIQKSVDKFKIIIVGDYEKIAGGSVKDKLDEYIKLYPGRIIFTGFLAPVVLKQFYSGLDVLVLPSIDPLEAFGIVQVEAMLSGTPVVASDMPGVREVIAKTGFGLLAKQKDPKNIADSVVRILKNPNLYAPKREVVSQCFNPSDSVKVYEDFLA
jgi:glycosyltransferase involved in cell wall biosynthesis